MRSSTVILALFVLIAVAYAAPPRGGNEGDRRPPAGSRPTGSPPPRSTGDHNGRNPPEHEGTHESRRPPTGSSPRPSRPSRPPRAN